MKIRKLIGLLAILFISVLRAEDPSFPGVNIEPSPIPRHWSFTTDFQTGYNDNVLTASSNKKASLFSGSNVSATYSRSTTQTSWDLSLGGGARYYYDQSSLPVDSNGFFNFTLASNINSRWTMDFSDHLLYAQQTPLSENNIIARRLGDSADHSFRAASHYEIFRRWFVDLSANHEVAVYTDEATARDLNRQVFGGSPALRFVYTPETTFRATYQFSRVDYETSPRNANTHTATLGWDQVFSPHWSGSLDSGGEWRQEDNSLSDNTVFSPYAKAQLKCQINSTAQVSGGTQYSQQETDLGSFQVSRALTAFVHGSWNLTRHFRWDTDLNFVSSDQQNSTTGGTGTLNEKTYVISQRLNWSLDKDTNLYLSWSHTKLDSEDPTRKFDQNLTTLGVSLLF